MSENNCKKEKSKFNTVFNIGSVGKINQGDVYTHTINEDYDTTSNTITINLKEIENMDPKYRESLQDFVAFLNKGFQKDKISPNEIAQIQKEMDEFSKEAATLSSVVDNENKKNSVRKKLKAIAESVVKVSPKIAETIASLTPLAPFSKLIGETFESMVQNALSSN